MQSTSDETLRSRLLEAYEADPNRSKMGRLRKQYDTIIDLQKGGMSLENILAVLNADKKPEDRLTMATFNGYLYLLRKENTNEKPLEVKSITQAPSKKMKKAKKTKTTQPDSPESLNKEQKEIKTNESSVADNNSIDSIAAQKKAESLRLAEKYSGKSADESSNSITKYL